MSLSALVYKSIRHVYAVVILPGILTTIVTTLFTLLVCTSLLSEVYAAGENPGDSPGNKPAPEGRSLADGLKSIAEDPKVIVDSLHNVIDKTQTTIKEQSKALLEDPLLITEGLKKAVEPESLVQEPQSTNSVEGTIESRDEVAYDPTTRSIYPGFYYRFRKLLKEWEQKLGLEVAFSYDVIGQQYFDDVDNIGGLAGEAAVSGRWLLFGNKKDRPAYLSFRLRTRDAISNKPPSDISSETGLFWKTVDGFNDSGFQIPSMYFSQELRKREVILRYGQFPIDDFFDSHRFRSAKKFFLNQAFSSNPSVNFPSFGAGFVVQWNPNENWELIGGASNIQGTEQGKEIDFGLASTALFESAQVRYRFSAFKDKEAEIRVMGWHSDVIEDEDIPRGRGLSVTFGYDGFVKGEEFAFRFAASEGDATSTDTSIFMAYGREIRSYDHWGFGLGAGRSSSTAKWQAMVETYYRWRVFKELMITPDLQIILGDHLDRDTKVSVIVGLRLGLIF